MGLGLYIVFIISIFAFTGVIFGMGFLYGKQKVYDDFELFLIQQDELKKIQIKEEQNKKVDLYV